MTKMSYRFIWDENKAASNIVDHQGVTFDEASTVFDSSLARIFDDEIHSFDERREIISARLPTRGERKKYEENIEF